MLTSVQLLTFRLFGQSSLEITMPCDPAVGHVTFHRVNETGGPDLTDTFRNKQTSYHLAVKNIPLPGIGFIKIGERRVREVILAPGFPLNITVSLENPVPLHAARSANKQAAGNGINQRTIPEKTAGPWAVLDSLYRQVSLQSNALFEQIVDADSARRPGLYDRLLKNIDTGAAKVYRPLKDYLLFRFISRAILSSDQILELNDYQVLHQLYLYQLAYGSFRNELDNRYQSKLKVLSLAQHGNAAPLFALKDSSGKTYRLEDYKGKVVYLDLWASWCLPCRLETPYMHRILKRYRDRDDLIIIGVAVSDKLRDWKNALKQDKPAWLQLHDNNTFVANAYSARSIPRYILIDKAGNVSEYYAPAPSDPAKLIQLIDRELLK